MNSVNVYTSHEILKHVDVKTLNKMAKSSKKMKTLANAEALYRVKNKGTSSKEMKELAKYYKVPPLFGPQTLRRTILQKIKI